MRSLVVLVLLVLLGPPAHAAISYMSSFDLLDTDDASPDLLDLPSTVGNGAVDGDIYVSQLNARGSSNGGASNSPFSGYLNLASGETAYWSKPADRTLGVTDVSAHVAISFPSALPTGGRNIAWFIQDTDGGIGCLYAVSAASGNASTVVAYHFNNGSPVLMGTSRLAMRLKQCNGYPRISCYQNSDCPSGVTCGSTKYWGELTMRQRRSGDQVTCDLSIHGQPQWSPTWRTAPVGTISDVRIGAPFAYDTAALTMNVDDIVVATNEDAGNGWVGFLTPNANGAQTEWAIQSCGTGATYWQCVDAYASAGQPNDVHYPALSAQSLPRTFSVGLTDPPNWLDGFTEVPAAAWSLVARTNGTGSGVWNLTGALVPQSGADRGTASGSVTHPSSTTTQWLSGVDLQPWSVSGLTNASVRISATSKTAPTVAAARAKALGVMYYGKQTSSAFIVPTLSDHNEGTDDGKKTVYLVGDSLLLGTAGVTCTNDPTLACSQDTYCSWNAFSNPESYQDKPTGGCTSDTQCRTCVGQRLRSPDGAGYACTADGQCPVSGTCNMTTEVCDDNANVPCAGDSDCALGGDCDTTATCNDSCPGNNANGSPATCPTGNAGSWATGLAGKIAVDTVVSCPLGNERTWEMEANRWEGILDGVHATCGTLKGLGACTCSTATDCDSGAGGTCTNGVCTAGNAATCTWAGVCETAVCKFPLPDYVVIMEGANDLREFSPQAPECSEPGGYGPQSQVIEGGQITDAGWGAQFSVCRRNCTSQQLALSCVADSDCSSISSSSRCIGQALMDETPGQGYACINTVNVYAAYHCGMRNIAEGADDDGTLNFIHGCNTDSDCNGGTCSINDSSSRMLGWCSCTSTSQCPSKSACVGGRCRRTCTTDADCTSGATRSGSCHDAGGGVKVCKGRCTCPCDALSCSTDADCSVGPILTYNGQQTWVPGGVCSGGKCSQCGRDTCARLSPGPTARTQEFVSAERYVARMDRLRASLAALSDSGDGRPVLIVVEHPIYSASDDGCRNVGVLFRDPGGGLRTATTRLLERGHHVVTGTRTAWEPMLWPAAVWNSEGPPPTLVYPNSISAGLTWDGIHFVIRSATVISDLIASYLNTLGACTINGAPQRYCYNPTSTTWGDACVDAFGCSGVESCTPRPCTGESDCPASGDACRAE